MSEAVARVYQDPDIQTAVDQVYRDERIQTDVQDLPPTPPTKPRIITPSSGEGLKIILIIGGIVLVLVLAAAILKGRGFGPSRAKTGDTKAPVENRASARHHAPLSDQGNPGLEAADGLAGEGRFEEAIHLLLRLSENTLEQRALAQVEPASTSREILAGVRLPAVAHDAYGQLVRGVEAARFARRAVDADGFARARAAYQRFSAGLHGAPARAVER